MARPRVHDERAGERLLEAAKELLRTEGPHALSVRAVADAADTTHRAVYSLYGSKQGMLDALAEHGYLDLARRVRAIRGTRNKARDLVRAGAEGFRGFATEEPALFRLTFEQVSVEVLRQPRVVEAAIASYAALAERVAAVRDAGQIHKRRTDAACIYAFHAVCQGLASSELAARRPPEGPGFWTGRLPAALDALWWDTLTGTVGQFAVAPATE